MFLTKPKPTPATPDEFEQANSDAAATLEAFGRAQAVIEFTPQGVILDANENFTSTVGYTLDEIRGQHHRMFVDPAEASTDGYRSFWARLADGEFFAGEYKRFNKAGDQIWLSASYNPVLDESGAVVKVVKIASDITATKVSSLDQEALLDALGRSQACIEFKPDGTIVKANDNFLNALGYTEDEIRGQHHRIFCDPDYTATGDYKNFWAQLGSGKFFGGRFNRFTKSGAEIWILATYNPVFDKSGNVVRVVKYASDITSEVQAELQSKKDAQSVGHSVATSTTEMAATIEEISKNVARTASLAQDAESAAQSSTNATEALQESSRAIGKVVSVIQELADQTNLLALNATIEAARAGESGRSFAVVANEVKDLASETSNATQSIEQSVQEIQTRILEVSESIGRITESVTEVSGNTNTVAAAIEEQSITMGELSKTAEGLVKLAETN